MAGDLASAGLCQLGGHIRAFIDGDRAPEPEPAARGRVDHLRRLALVGLGADRQRGARVGHGGDQQLGIGVARIGQHLLDRPGLGDLAGVHHDQPVGNVPRAGDVVGDVEDGHAHRVAQRRHQVEQADPDRHVEHRHRLVGQDQPRAARERLGEADPLPLAAAELVRVPLEHAGVQPDHLEYPGGLGLALLGRQLGAVQLEAAEHAVRDPEDRVDRGERVLEDHRHLAAVAQPRPPRAHRRQRGARVFLALGEVDLPARRLVHPGEQPRDGRLAAAALPRQGDDLALADLEVHVVDGVQGPLGQRPADLEMPAQVLGPQQRRGHRATLLSSA